MLLCFAKIKNKIGCTCANTQMPLYDLLLTELTWIDKKQICSLASKGC